MLFTSLVFLGFFLIVYSVYWSIPNQKAKEVWLLFASIIFYGTWSFGFLFHFLAAIYINYRFINYLYTNTSKKVLTLAVALNVINLGIFKYFYFFTSAFASLSGMQWLLDLEKSMTFKIILPLAISFYTFQMLAFVVDVYYRRITEKVTLLDFSLFVLFFPQLIAGPIMRYGDFIPQLKNIKAKPEFLSPGLTYIALGIVKKVLIADNLASLTEAVWMDPSKYDWISIVLAIYAFTWQIYCDFSGYTDIARGCAFLLGFDIPENFLSPYFADSAKDIWQRWHITLSTWLRDYLYIPLGGNRKGEGRSHVNIIITFTLGGLWHGANYTYIIWGFFHGVMLFIERLVDKLPFKLVPQNIIGKLIGIFYAYHVFSFGALFFRSNNLSDAGIILNKIFTLAHAATSLSREEVETTIYLCFFGFLIQLVHYIKLLKSTSPIILKLQNFGAAYFVRWNPYWITASYITLLFLISLYTRAGKEFVYFQF